MQCVPDFIVCVSISNYRPWHWLVPVWSIHTLSLHGIMKFNDLCEPYGSALVDLLVLCGKSVPLDGQS